MKDFYAFFNTDDQYDDGYLVTGKMRCKYFDIDQWFELGKNVWNKRHIVFDDRISYVTNDITKPYKLKIIKYGELMHNMFELYQ